MKTLQAIKAKKNILAEVESIIDVARESISDALMEISGHEFEDDFSDLRLSLECIESELDGLSIDTDDGDCVYTLEQQENFLSMKLSSCPSEELNREYYWTYTGSTGNILQGNIIVPVSFEVYGGSLVEEILYDWTNHEETWKCELQPSTNDQLELTIKCKSYNKVDYLTYQLVFDGYHWQSVSDERLDQIQNFEHSESGLPRF